jgi:holin-like protein
MNVCVLEGSMLQSLAVLMFFQFLGELLVKAAELPLPGPVCGMLFLVAWLRSGRALPAELTGVATGLLDHFGLLFVPAGVSIIGFGALIMRDGPAIVLALLLSIVATVAVTACAFGRRQAAQRDARSRRVP